MEKHDHYNQLTNGEKKLYLLGTIVFAGLILITLFLSDLVSPLRLLQLRLSFVGISLVYHLAIYFYYQRVRTVKQEPSVTEQNEITILFNGKKIGQNCYQAETRTYST